MLVVSRILLGNSVDSITGMYGLGGELQFQTVCLCFQKFTFLLSNTLRKSYAFLIGLYEFDQLTANGNVRSFCWFQWLKSNEKNILCQWDVIFTLVKINNLLIICFADRQAEHLLSKIFFNRPTIQNYSVQLDGGKILNYHSLCLRYNK